MNHPPPKQARLSVCLDTTPVPLFVPSGISEHRNACHVRTARSRIYSVRLTSLPGFCHATGMCVSPYGWWLSAIVILWSVWFIVLCRERGWFNGVWTEWFAMDPLTSAFMAVMCAYCTVKAQKPGGTNEPQNVSQQESAESGGPAFQAGTAFGMRAGPVADRGDRL